MKVSILKPKDFKTSNWTGGTTTELYIFPLESSYIERDFDFRISSAQIELEASTFTSLPGVNRKLMILQGEIEITHKDKYSKILKAFEQDSFKGEWNTSSVGKCLDFNVMTSGNPQSDLFSLQLSKNEKSTIRFEKNWKTLLIFAFEGNFEMEVNQEILVIEQGNLLVVNDLDKFEFSVFALSKSKLIVTLID